MGCHYLPQGPGPENGEIDSEAAKKGLLNIPVLDSSHVRIGSRGEFDQTVFGRSDPCVKFCVSFGSKKKACHRRPFRWIFSTPLKSFEQSRRFNWTLIDLFSVSWQAFWILWFWGTFWFWLYLWSVGLWLWVRAELSLLTGPWHWTWEGLEIGSLMLVDNSTLSGVCKEPSDHQNISFAFCCCLRSVATQESINFSICGWKEGVKGDQIGFGLFLSCPMLSPNSYDKLPNFTQFHLFVHFYYWASNCVTLSGKAGAQHCQLKIVLLLLKNHWRNIKLGLNLKDLSFFLESLNIEI